MRNIYGPFSEEEIRRLKATLHVLNQSGARLHLAPEQEAICQRIERTLTLIQDWKYHPETLQWEYMPADAVVFGGVVITQECGCKCVPCAAIYNSPRYLDREVDGPQTHCKVFPCTGGKRLWTAHWEGKRLGEDTNPEAVMRLVESKAAEVKRAAEVAELERLTSGDLG